MNYALAIILSILGIAVTFAGLYLRHGNDEGIMDLDEYRKGERS